MRIFALIVFLGGSALAASLIARQPRPDVTAPLPARLSETGLYVAGAASAVRADNLSFAPQYPLWTDGAAKRRWIHLPAGTAIDASAADAWSFPAGTRLWKELSFGGKRVETRTMERLPDGSWRYATYRWLPDGSDAVLTSPAGESVPVAAPAGRHVIPSEADCRACHEGRTSPVLGFTALQLSPDRDPGALHAPPPEPGDVDLAALAERGLLRGLPPSLLSPPPRIQAPSATARAALGYLHANCGGCHNTEGPLASVGIALAQPAAGGAPGATLASIVGRPSRFRLAARPDAELRVAAGHSDASVLALRMRSRDPVAQMPPIGTSTVDEEAIALIERWIDEDLTARPSPVASAKGETAP